MWMNGNKPGTATIYAVVDGKAISCEITVVEKDVLTLYGDVTQDQMIEITDLVCLSKYIMGSINLDYYARKNADCNADGKINNIDAIVLQQFLVQRIKELPFSPVTE